MTTIRFLNQKYPRTPHLPWSPGKTRDDRTIETLESLIGVPIIISEKIDGSNTVLTSESIFARSHSSLPTHPSFNYLKSLHAQIKYMIPKDMSIFGEYTYAVHTLVYKVPEYFHGFGVRLDMGNNLWLSWDETLAILKSLNLISVPVLFSGVVGCESELKSLTEFLVSQKSCYGETCEGVVVRVARDFYDREFKECVAKYVRENHVAEDSKHWMSGEIFKQELVK